MPQGATTPSPNQNNSSSCHQQQPESSSSPSPSGEKGSLLDKKTDIHNSCKQFGHSTGHHGNGGTAPLSGKTRTRDKYRVVYSDFQRMELEKEFLFSNYITIRRKSELALSLNLSERQVKIWFQNRRAKERKQKKKKEEAVSKMTQGKVDKTSEMKTEQAGQQGHVNSTSSPTSTTVSSPTGGYLPPNTVISSSGLGAEVNYYHHHPHHHHHHHFSYHPASFVRDYESIRTDPPLTTMRDYVGGYGGGNGSEPSQVISV